MRLTFYTHIIALAEKQDNTESVRAVLQKLYTSEAIDRIIKNPNAHGPRTQAKKDGKDPMKTKILDACGNYMKIDEADDLQRRYKHTLEVLKEFNNIQILPGRRVGIHWSDIDYSSRYIYQVMCEDFIEKSLGPKNSLPLYCCSEFWSVKSMIASVMSNNNPLKKAKKVILYLLFINFLLS